jgi:hypothetical protein
LATKPEDWDENEHEYIGDPAAKKPESWLEEEPQRIPHPDYQKPKEWDDETDGEWIPPEIRKFKKLNSFRKSKVHGGMWSLDPSAHKKSEIQGEVDASNDSESQL